MTESQPVETATSQPSQRVGVRLPLAEPRWSYVLLASLALIWLVMEAVGWIRGLELSGSQTSSLLLDFGALQSTRIASGEYWRLLTSTFLHSGLVHLLFNSWALYALGREVERLYGAARFLTIYFLSGIGGSLTSYALGGNHVAVGASGAIFGLVGTLIAYFWIHRAVFGQGGQQQLRSLLMVAGVNLVIGFTIPGIDNLGHIGGLVAGAFLGWVLVPRYVAPSLWQLDQAPVAQDSNSLRRRLPVVAIVLVVMVALGAAGTLRWNSSPEAQLTEALVQLEAQNFQGAVESLRPLSENVPDDPVILFYLGVAEANLGNLSAAAQAWERSSVLEPDLAGIYWNLATVYAQMGRNEDAIGQLRRYIELVGDDAEKAEAEQFIQALSR